MKNVFGKVITAMITPFDKNGEVNLEKARELARKLADEGSDALVITGTTGESPTLSHEEDLLLYTAVLDEVGDRVKIIAGTGSNSTATTIKYTQIAQRIGVHGAMIVVPYYNKPSQEGMKAHFLQVAESVDIPLMIYNIPGRTGVNMLPETTLEIAQKAKRYVAIKEASGDLKQMKLILEANKRDDFVLYSGDDALTLEVVKMGGKGVVSVASHLVGRDLQKMIALIEQGKLVEAEIINNKLAELFKVLFITSNPSPVKAALNIIGFEVGGTRLPLVMPSDLHLKEIKRVLQETGLI